MSMECGLYVLNSGACQKCFADHSTDQFQQQTKYAKPIVVKKKKEEEISMSKDKGKNIITIFRCQLPLNLAHFIFVRHSCFCLQTTTNCTITARLHRAPFV